MAACSPSAQTCRLRFSAFPSIFCTFFQAPYPLTLVFSRSSKKLPGVPKQVPNWPPHATERNLLEEQISLMEHRAHRKEKKIRSEDRPLQGREGGGEGVHLTPARCARGGRFVRGGACGRDFVELVKGLRRRATWLRLRLCLQTMSYRGSNKA